MKRHTVHKSGFTIVELIVVIVIIGILAAVTVVAYRGIQERAHNSRTISMVAMYEKAIVTYSKLNGKYPAMDPDAGGVCLGTGYDDRVGSDGIGDCGESAWYLNEDPIFNAAIEGIVSSHPIVNDRSVAMPYNPTSYVGAAFHYFPPDPTEPLPEDQGGFIVDGISSPYYIMYVLEGGNVDCGNPHTLATDEPNGGWPKMTLTMPPGQKWSYSDGKTTACAIYLPNPS